MLPGVAFPHRHFHERVHLAPLIDRLADVLAPDPSKAQVVVHADTRPPARRAWNIQVFHGLGDKDYVCNPIFLQRRRWPRVRTALNLPLAALHLPAPFLRQPKNPGLRASRYQQLNAYGPRFADRFYEMVKDAVVSRFGHVALNERPDLRPDHEGPLLWLPTWDNRAFLGGVNQSSLATMADEVMQVAQTVPVLVKYHPHAIQRNQCAAIRRRLAKVPNITVAPADANPYDLLHGARGVLSDTGSLGFEAYCMEFPVAVVQNPGVQFRGLHGELAQRVTTLRPGDGQLANWAETPLPASDLSWARDLMESPSPRRNDAFAADIRQHMVEQPGL